VSCWWWAAVSNALLAVLLLRAGAVVRTADLTEALWGERPPLSARANLHS